MKKKPASQLLNVSDIAGKSSPGRTLRSASPKSAADDAKGDSRLKDQTEKLKIKTRNSPRVLGNIPINKKHARDISNTDKEELDIDSTPVTKSSKRIAKNSRTESCVVEKVHDSIKKRKSKLDLTHLDTEVYDYSDNSIPVNKAPIQRGRQSTSRSRVSTPVHSKSHDSRYTPESSSDQSPTVTSPKRGRGTNDKETPKRKTKSSKSPKDNEDVETKGRKTKMPHSPVKGHGRSRDVSESPSPSTKNKLPCRKSVRSSPIKNLSQEDNAKPRSLRKHRSPNAKSKGDMELRLSDKKLPRKSQDQHVTMTETIDEKKTSVSIISNTRETSKYDTPGHKVAKTEIDVSKTEVEMEESDETDETDMSEYSDTSDSASSDSDSDTKPHAVMTLDMTVPSVSDSNDHIKTEHLPSTSSALRSVCPLLSKKSDIDYNRYRTYLSHESRESAPLGLSDLIAKVNCSIDGVDTKMNVLFGEAEEPDYCDEDVKLVSCDSEDDSDKTVDFSIQPADGIDKSDDSHKHADNLECPDDDSKKQIDLLGSTHSDDVTGISVGDTVCSAESKTNDELDGIYRASADNDAPCNKNIDFVTDEQSTVQPLQIDLGDVCPKNVTAKQYPTSPIKLNRETVKVALSMTGNLLSPVTLNEAHADNPENIMETMCESETADQAEMDTVEQTGTESLKDKTTESKEDLGNNDITMDTEAECCELDEEMPRNIFDLFGITLNIRKSDGSLTSGTDGKIEEISSCADSTKHINEGKIHTGVKEMNNLNENVKMSNSEKVTESITELDTNSMDTDDNNTHYNTEVSVRRDNDGGVLTDTKTSMPDKEAIVILSDDDDDDEKRSISAFSICSSIDRGSYESLRASPRIRPTMTTIRQTFEPKPLEILSMVEKTVTDKKSAFVSEELEDYIETNKENVGPLSVRNDNRNDNKASENNPDFEMQISEEDIKNRLANSDPDFNEIDGQVFLSFPSEESLKAHVEVEKNVEWLSEPLLRKMCSLKSMHARATSKDHYRITEVKSKDEQKQSYRGIPARVKKYEKLFKQELEIILAIKEKRIPAILVTKTPEKTADITKIKGWKEKYGSTEELKEATGLHFTDAGKLHWRTEERILKNFNADDVKDIDLDIKKKRRKLVNFSKKKNNKSDSSVANAEKYDEDVVYEGYVYDKSAVLENETEGEEVHKKENTHSEEKIPYSIRFRSQYKYGVRKNFVKKMGLDAKDELILKKLGTASEYLRDPTRDKDGQSRNKKGNKSVAMKLTQTMAAAAASALDKRLIIKAKAICNQKEKKKPKGGVKKDDDEDYNPTRDDELAFYENQIRDDETVEECQRREEQRKREARNARRRELRARKSAVNVAKMGIAASEVGASATTDDTVVKQEPFEHDGEDDSFEADEKHAEKKRVEPEADADVEKKCVEPGCRYGCICHLCKFSDSGGEDKDSKHLGDTDLPVKPPCDKEYCKLGCICDSIDTKLEENSHCRKPACMFKCKCPPAQPKPNIPNDDKKSAKKRKRRSCIDKKPKDEVASHDEMDGVDVQPESLCEPQPEPDDPWEPPASKKKRGPTRFTNLPRRQSTYRLAKNLDAVSRKAMQVYETSEKFDSVRIRKRRSDPADEIEYVNDELDCKPPEAATETSHFYDDAPDQSKQKLDWREALQMTTLDNPEDVLKRRDNLLTKPGASSSKTKMSARCTKPETFIPEEDDLLEQEDPGGILEISDMSDGETFPEAMDSCARTDGYKGEWKKSTAPRQKVSRSGSGSPEVIDLIDSDNEMDTVDGHPYRPSRSYLSSEGSATERLGLSGKTKITGRAANSPAQEIKWRTQMVCLKAKKKTQDGDDTNRDESEIKLLEIISNCKWEQDRTNMLSKISHIISKDYPQNHIIMWCNYVLQFLPQADKAAVIPPELQVKLPRKMFSIRVRVTKNISDIESAENSEKAGEEEIGKTSQTSKWEQAMLNLTSVEKRNYMNLRQQKKLIEKIRFAERLKDVITTEESKGNSSSKFSVSREGIEKALKRYKTQLWKAFTGNSGMTITQLRQALQSAKNASYTDRINQAIEAIENKANGSCGHEASPGLSPSTAARIQANQGMVIQCGTATSTVTSDRQAFINLSVPGSSTFSDITPSLTDISNSSSVTIGQGSQQTLIGTNSTVIVPHATGTSVIGQHATGTSFIGSNTTGTAVIGQHVTGSTVIGPNTNGTAVIGPSTTGTTVIGQHVTGTTVIGPNTSGTSAIGPNTAATAVVGQNVMRTTVSSQNITVKAVSGQNYVISSTVSGSSVVSQSKIRPTVGAGVAGSHGIPPVLPMGKMLLVPVDGAGPRGASPILSGTMTMVAGDRMPLPGTAVRPVFAGTMVGADAKNNRMPVTSFNSSSRNLQNIKNPNQNIQQLPTMIGGIINGQRVLFRPDQHPGGQLNQVRPSGGPTMIQNIQFQPAPVLMSPTPTGCKSVEPVNPGPGTNIINGVKTSVVNNACSVPVSLQNGVPQSTTVCSTTMANKFIPIPSVSTSKTTGASTLTPVRFVGPVPLSVSSTTGGPIPLSSTPISLSKVAGQPNQPPHASQMFRVLQMSNTAADGKPIIHLIPVTTQCLSNAVTTSSADSQAKIATVELLQPAGMSSGVLTMGNTTQSGLPPSVSPGPILLPSSANNNPGSTTMPLHNGRVASNVAQIVTANITDNSKPALSVSKTSFDSKPLTTKDSHLDHVPQLNVNNDEIECGNVCDLTKCDSDVEGFDDCESLASSLRSISSLGDSIKSSECSEGLQKVTTGNPDNHSNPNTNRASPTNSEDLISNFIEYATETGLQIADTLGPIDEDVESVHSIEEKIGLKNCDSVDTKTSGIDRNVIDDANKTGDSSAECMKAETTAGAVLCVEDDEQDSDGCLIIDESDSIPSEFAPPKADVIAISTESRKRKLTGEGLPGAPDVTKRSRSESPMTMEEIMSMVGEDIMPTPSANSIYISDSEENSDIDVESLESVDQLLQVPPVSQSRRKSSLEAMDCDDSMKITKMLQHAGLRGLNVVVPPGKNNREKVRRMEAAALFRTLALTVYKHNPKRLVLLDKKDVDHPTTSCLPKVTILKETKILMDALKHKMDRLQECVSDGLDYQASLQSELSELKDSFAQSGVPKKVIQNFLKSVSSSTLSLLKSKAKDKMENASESFEFANINSRVSNMEQVTKNKRSTDNAGVGEHVKQQQHTDHSHNPNSPLVKVPVFPLQTETPLETHDPQMSAQQIGTIKKEPGPPFFIGSPHSLLTKSVSFTIKCRRPKPKVEIFVDSPESSRSSPDVMQHLQPSGEAVTVMENVCKISSDGNFSQTSQQSNLEDYEVRSATGDGIIYGEVITENVSNNLNLCSDIQTDQSDSSYQTDHLNSNYQTASQSNDVIVLDSDLLPNNVNSTIQSDVVVIEDSPNKQ